MGSAHPAFDRTIHYSLKKKPRHFTPNLKARPGRSNKHPHPYKVLAHIEHPEMIHLA
jgi:hypothetical protein